MKMFRNKIIAVALVLSLVFLTAFTDVGNKNTVVLAAQETTEDGWKFEIVNGTEAKISGYAGTDTKIQIPEEVQGSLGTTYAVTEIAFGAFAGCSNLTDISLPEGLRTIGDNAFIECTSLTKIELPDTVETIAMGAFRNCTNLTEVIFPKTLTSIGDWMFAGCTGMTEMTIPEGVTSIGKNAFYHCQSLQTLQLPSTLESIGNKAFVDTSIETLEIPKNVSDIGDGLFNGLDDYDENSYTKIKQIVVDGENSTYDSRDNCNAIIETATNRLLYGSSSTKKIPEGVTSIASYAFSGCKDLDSIEIPSTVNDIGGHVIFSQNAVI